MNDRRSIHERTRDEAAVRAVLGHLRTLWSDVTSGRASAKAIAALFTEDASFIVGDGTYLRGRAAIAAYYRRMVAGADAFGTSIKDTTVIAEAESVQFLHDAVAAMVGQGGIHFPGETVVPAERKGIQTSVLTNVDGAWLVAAYQNTRIQHSPESSA